MLVFPVGLAAAVFLAVGFVLQQHAAAQEPPEEILSPVLLLRLVRRPVWLAGIGAMIVGALLGAAALDLGSLALVEPLLATNLLFALPLAAAWHRRRLSAREWVGAVLLSAGLGGFVAAAAPGNGDTTHLPWPNWVIAAVVITAVVVGLVALGKRTNLGEEATLLALAAGVVYGLQDALTRRLLAHGFHLVPAVTGWTLWSLVAVAVVGLLLAQSAFEAAPLTASLPAITAAEPVTGIALGVGVYGEGIRLSAIAITGEVVTMALMVAGVFLLARGPVVGAMGAAGGPGKSRLPSPTPAGAVGEPTEGADLRGTG